MQHYLYLFIDFISILFPLVFSFYPKANFSKKWKYLAPALFAGAIPFLGWDIWFTHLGVWGFNPNYLTGVYFFNLPVEEVLFFFCIPYACVFTYEAVNYLYKKSIPNQAVNFITDILIFGLLITATLNYHRRYTSITFFSIAAFLILLRRVWAVTYLGKFCLAFAFILIPFFLVNGVLTGTGLHEPVVWYNNNENLGLRMGTIPVEDTFYGMLLLLLDVSAFEFLSTRNKKAPN